MVKTMKLYLQCAVKDATDSIGTREFMHRIGLQVNYVPSTFIECSWIKPGEDEVMLNPDGSVTASSCGYGGVLRNREGAVLGAYTGSSLNRSVTFQELLAVEKGLECALLMNLKKVRVATDSYRAMQIIQGKETIPCGLSRGLAGLSAGMAIGIVGDAGVREYKRVFCRCKPLNLEEIAIGALMATNFESAKDGELMVKANGAPKKTGVSKQLLAGYFLSALGVAMYRLLLKKMLNLFQDLIISTYWRLEIRQVTDGVHHVPGLVEAHVSNMNEVWEVLQTGSNLRVVGATNAIEHSNRSH
ncbi:hypothetical protein IFM89_016946 [Coptis chinensis]|uniref:RNase H type-1 domain-containing protein n=1 Tax=Coptis chinensis TaxID=261450 RepID=A0A835H5Z2_9MAGN|nr:hypothetical protein IFM89_016946 [Coptis chinensis]